MNTKHTNPYIGPRTFRREDSHLFFGRDREAADLEALMVSEKLVLFYAQSGAGKSSLINARLIPRLEKKRFEVLPVARLGGDAPVGAETGNIYIFNLFRSLHRRAADPALFRSLTLSQFLKKLVDDQDGYFYKPELTQSLRDPKPWPRLLIIDQFEELFSTNVEAWQQREEFFRQLAQAMQDDPLLWVLLVMREDYIAALDPYAYLLPKGLRVRYYMERLSHDAAVTAIRNPVERIRPYAEGVAEKLAEDLSRVKVQKPDGTTGTEPGQYIEPVQLQVVCYSLWENLKPGNGITAQDLLDVGDVNQSLARYYDQRVSDVARAKHVPERRIRDWFEQKLITAGGIRSMVLQERETPSDGLADDVIQRLQSDLVRVEKRGGATWYELTHDRLVEPILASNKEWFGKNLNPFQRQALVWENQHRNDNWLLRDQAYEEVQPWVAEHQGELTDLEREFLEASRKKRDRQLEESIRERRNTNRIKAFAAAVVLLLIITIVVAAVAVRQAKIARAGELAAQSVSSRDKNFLVSLLLGVEAFKEQNVSIQAESALLGNALVNPKLDQFLSGHSASILSIAISPDGKTLASGGYDKFILLWNLETRQPIGKLSGFSELVRSIAFSPDGKTLASGGNDTNITLWDVETRQPIARLSGHKDSILSVAFSPDGKILASGSNDKNIILWDLKTRQPIAHLGEHKGPVQSVAFSPDSKTLASGSGDKTIILWNVESRKRLDPPLSGHTSSILSIAFSPDGNTLASGSYDRTIILWKVETHEPLAQLTGHLDTVRSVAFSPDGGTLASGSEDRSIILWNVKTHQLIVPLKGHANIVNSIAFSPDGKTLVSGCADKSIILWSWNDPPRLLIGQSLNENQVPVRAIAFSPDTKTLASGKDDGTIILWDVKTRLPIDPPLSGHTEPVNSVAFSTDGKTLASGNEDGTIILWDVETHKPIDPPLSGHTERVNSVAFSPDGKILASGSNDKSIILWDVETHKAIAPSLSEHTEPVTSVAFSRDGKMLASGSGDGTIILWNVETHKRIDLPLSGHSGPVLSVAFSRDGKTLASSSLQDGTILLWDLKTHKINGHLSGHLNFIYSLAFSPDGKTLASGSYDQTIILWDMKTRQPIGQPLSGQMAPVQTVIFSPDGKTLASRSNTIILWDLQPNSWIDNSCQRAGRNFRQDEWEIYFPNEEYRKICLEFPLETAGTPTATP